METSTGAAMVTLLEPATLPELAVMLALPRILPVTSPALTGAIVGADDVHVAEAVRSCVVPSV
jgi:hypothetical protein